MSFHSDYDKQWNRYYDGTRERRISARNASLAAGGTMLAGLVVFGLLSAFAGAMADIARQKSGKGWTKEEANRSGWIFLSVTGAAILAGVLLGG